jgi:hypothetical protein
MLKSERHPDVFQWDREKFRLHLRLENALKLSTGAVYAANGHRRISSWVVRRLEKWKSLNALKYPKPWVSLYITYPNYMLL